MDNSVTGTSQLSIVTNAFGVIIISEKASSNQIVFHLDYPILRTHTESMKFVRHNPCTHSLLVRRLLQIDDVENVTLTRNQVFVQVNEKGARSNCSNKLWQMALETIYRFLASGMPAVTSCASGAQHYHNQDGECITIPPRGETEAAIEDLINRIIRPVVLDEEGDLVFKSFNRHNGVVEVIPYGTCRQCPGAFSTIRSATLSLLRFYLPEVTSVEAAASSSTNSPTNTTDAQPVDDETFTVWQNDKRPSLGRPANSLENN